MKKNQLLIIILCIFSIFALCCSNKNTIEIKKNNDLFASDSILELTLETNFGQLFSDIDEKRFYHDAKISYINKNDRPISLNLKVKTRGYFRRDSNYCNFPPIKLKFGKKKKRKNTIFAKEKKLKLVTHCRTNIAEYEQYLFSEYLIYKIYNILTPKSYKVRLVKITYIDTHQAFDTLIKYGFLIENSKKMAKRNKAKVLEKLYLEQYKTNYDQITLLSVFQYMIANTDWSVWYLHNITLISADSTKPAYPVPYDFDFSKIAHTPYSSLSSIFELDSTQHSIYSGFCKDTIQLDYIFSIFNKNKNEIYELYKNFPLLDYKYKQKTLDVFDKFYYIINNKTMIKNEFLLKDSI